MLTFDSPRGPTVTAGSSTTLWVMDESTALRCPTTRRPLTRMTLPDAESVTGLLFARTGTPYGKTEHVLVRDDKTTAYPIAGRTPILLAPEALTARPPRPDLRDP